ncbi:MAG: peptidoglycan-binding protein [Brucellaceae bacterium]|nr:peptidoglycan-binding protein [Brucellaceae bacterium]
MTNQRSPLDNLNLRRERRPLASLDELNRTLSALEDHLRTRNEPENYNSYQPEAREEAPASPPEFLRHETTAPYQPRLQQAAVAEDHPHKEALSAIADELQRLRARTELRQAAAINDKLSSENERQQPQARLSAADRFIAGTSNFTSNVNHSPNTDAIMRRDFDELKRTVETLAREESLRRMSHRWDALDERFDNFEQQQSEKLSASQSAHFDPALETIATRLDDLRRAVEQLPDNQSHSLRQLDERLDEISRAILATSYKPQPEQDRAVFEELDRRFADLTSHLDEQYRNSAHKTALNDDRFIQALENRLDHITRQVNEQTAVLQAAPVAAPQADQQLMRNLEKQLSFITEQLSKPESLMPELAEIKPRLDVIERAIDMNRDTVLNVAREAAEEAIRQVVDKGSARDTGFARQLADDLKALEQLTLETDERNNRTFSRVHDTLLKIADRLGQIEQDSLQKPPHAELSRPTAQPREQETGNRYASQFSIPEWGAEAPKPAGNASRSFSTAPSPADAAIEAARAAVKSAANPVADKTHNDSDDEPPAGGTRKSLLGGLAQAVRRSKAETQASAQAPAATPASADTFKIEASDLMELDPQPAGDHPTGKSEDIRTDQTLAAMPDLNAIIRRVRDEQRGRGTEQGLPTGKNDLISAARRAAQAAADETERLRDEEQTDGNLNGDITSDENRVAAADKPKRSLRKPLLLALGAVIIAATGLQLGNNYLVDTKDNAAPQSADVSNVQSAPVAAKPVVTEEAKPALPTVSTLDNAGYPAEQVTPSVQITSLNHDPFADGAEAQPLGARPFPTQPLSATPMAGSTQAIIKPVTLNQPATSAPAMQPMPAALDSDQQSFETAPVQAAPEIKAEKNDTSAEVKPSAIPAIPKDAGPIALRNAAESGDARALYEIGMRYTDGRGVASDYAEAAKWYALSAERGFAPAQYRLGNFSEKGLGMPRDAAKATKLYEQAAVQGNASAMHNLAVLYAMGTGGGAAASDADTDKAAKWFFKAAELGVKDSQYNLGILTAKGLGRTQNLEESYKWFALAAEAGDADAAEKRDQVAKSLKPEQLERAVNLTKLWKPKDMIDEANAVQIPDAWADDKAVTTASVDMKKAIRNIQLILQKNGYDAGSADGVMGNKTRQAIAAFQKSNGMKPTGEVDQPLVEALLAKNS